MVKIVCVHISIKLERRLLFEQKCPFFSFSSKEAGNKVWMWITDHALNNSALVVQTEEHSDGFWINPEVAPFQTIIFWYNVILISQFWIQAVVLYLWSSWVAMFVEHIRFSLKYLSVTLPPSHTYCR